MFLILWAFDSFILKRLISRAQSIFSNKISLLLYICTYICMFVSILSHVTIEKFMAFQLGNMYNVQKKRALDNFLIPSMHKNRRTKCQKLNSSYIYEQTSAQVTKRFDSWRHRSWKKARIKIFFFCAHTHSCMCICVCAVITKNLGHVYDLLESK